MAQRKHYTVYDRMDEVGVFSQNTANANSRDQDGRPAYKKAEYPKMLYHPLGLTTVVNPAEIVEGPGGKVKEFNERRELVSKVVNSGKEEKRWRDEGWHEHPAQAITAGGGEAPAFTTGQALELEIEKNKKKDDAIAKMREMLIDQGLDPDDIDS